MPLDTERYEQARDHLNRLVSLYALTDDDAENGHILRDIEWLVEHMAEMSEAELLDAMAPQTGDFSPSSQPSSKPMRRTAA